MTKKTGYSSGGMQVIQMCLISTAELGFVHCSQTLWNQLIS